MPASPSTRLGRTAALINALAILAALAALALLRLEASATVTAFLGNALASATAFACWSLVLAARALWRGEKRAWPLVVIAMFLIEVNIPCLLVAWGLLTGGRKNDIITLAITLGLPVFVPFLTLASLIAAPIAWWRATRASPSPLEGEGSGVRGQGSPFATRRFLCWYCAIVLLLTVLLLPWPLFVFCVSATEFYGPASEHTRDWRQRVANHTPDFIRDRVADWVQSSAGGWKSWSVYDLIYARMRFNGWMSRNRLWNDAISSQGGNNESFSGLYWTNPDAALEFAQLVVDKRYNALTENGKIVSFVGRYELAVAISTIARHGSPDIVRRYLDPKVNTPSEFRPGLIEELQKRHRNEFLPDLERYVDDYRSGGEIHCARRWLSEQKP